MMQASPVRRAGLLPKIFPLSPRQRCKWHCKVVLTEQRLVGYAPYRRSCSNTWQDHPTNPSPSFLPVACMRPSHPLLGGRQS